MTDTSSFARVVDALTAIPFQAAYANLFTSAVVCDGPWVQSVEPDNLVMIGLTAAGDSVNSGTQAPATFAPMGNGRRQEDYGVVCQIRMRTGDTDVGAQKRIRDLVMGQYGAFELTIAQNGTLYGLIVPATSGQMPSTWVEANSYSQLDPDVETGRVFAVEFTVHVSNSLNAY